MKFGPYFSPYKIINSERIKDLNLGLQAQKYVVNTFHSIPPINYYANPRAKCIVIRRHSEKRGRNKEGPPDSRGDLAGSSQDVCLALQLRCKTAHNPEKRAKRVQQKAYSLWPVLSRIWKRAAMKDRNLFHLFGSCEKT